MKGDPNVLQTLNKGLAAELTAINQYFIQAKMCKDWGYAKLAAKHYAESIDEMKHAEKLIDRIIFLEGVPNVGGQEPVEVGANVKEQLENDLRLETGAVQMYNQAIDICTQANDNGTRELFAELLVGSEHHVDWLETQLHVINEIGLENYLTEQLDSGE